MSAGLKNQGFGLFSSPYFNKIEKNGLTQAETMGAYLGGSAFQTVIDNPVTAYRQLVQQYAKDVSYAICNALFVLCSSRSSARNYTL